MQPAWCQFFFVVFVSRELWKDNERCRWLCSCSAAPKQSKFSLKIQNNLHLNQGTLFVKIMLWTILWTNSKHTNFYHIFRRLSLVVIAASKFLAVTLVNKVLVLLLEVLTIEVITVINLEGSERSGRSLLISLTLPLIISDTHVTWIVLTAVTSQVTSEALH